MEESEGAVWRAGCAQKANKVLEKQRYRAVTGGGMVGCVEERNVSSSSMEHHEMSRKGLGNKLHSLPWSRSEADLRDK